jgi:hypothetical protein
MLGLVKLELRRVKYHLPLIVVNAIIVSVFFLLAAKLVPNNELAMVWVLLPFIAMALNSSYRLYFNSHWVQFIMDKGCGMSVFPKAFMIIGVLQNLSTAVILMLLIQGSFFQIVIFWMLLDIMGYLLHCICVLSSPSIGVILSHVFVVPLVYPWVLLGELAANNAMFAFKIILATWVLLYSAGTLFYQLCFKVGQASG